MATVGWLLWDGYCGMATLGWLLGSLGGGIIELVGGIPLIVAGDFTLSHKPTLQSDQ
jgi:hypothetical protein